MKLSNSSSSVEKKPLAPLSAYNLFFQCQRARILSHGTDPRVLASLPPISHEEVQRIAAEHKAKRRQGIKRAHRKSHGVIGFRELARTVAQAWKQIDGSTKRLFETFAEAEKKEYRALVTAWKKANQDPEAPLQQVPEAEVLSSLLSSSASALRGAGTLDDEATFQRLEQICDLHSSRIPPSSRSLQPRPLASAPLGEPRPHVPTSQNVSVGPHPAGLAMPDSVESNHAHSCSNPGTATTTLASLLALTNLSCGAQEDDAATPFPLFLFSLEDDLLDKTIFDEEDPDQEFAV